MQFSIGDANLRLWGVTLLALLVLGGCSHVQTSSGEAYLARSADETAAKPKHGGFDRFQALVRQAADVEPVLKLPARIGIAALNDSPENFGSWADLMGSFASLGELVLVSLLLREMMAETVPKLYGDDGGPYREIQLAAARQHLDAVLIYTLDTRQHRNKTLLAVADLAIIGGAFSPTRQHFAQSEGHAMLVDVRNGYIYGTAYGEAIIEGYSGSWGAKGYTKKLRADAEYRALAALQEDTKQMFVQLALELAVR